MVEELLEEPCWRDFAHSPAPPVVAACCFPGRRLQTRRSWSVLGRAADNSDGENQGYTRQSRMKARTPLLRTTSMMSSANCARALSVGAKCIR